ncbi:response regulator [Thalassomonas actiniarum]|uniref:Response regulator n=1 Tax=Thalassomonas actiniarum TaxID=485447 RepID=A0AAE9YUE9_9GAMM|nr:response regulator [Thalassomonas actiniarum]WDE01421.1 response regulator [Thalassomonas actiniarum]
MADENVGFTILIVDDNPTNIDLLRRFLAPEHYQVAALTSGEQALKLMAKIAPDLILLDIMMPGLDGY